MFLFAATRDLGWPGQRCRLLIFHLKWVLEAPCLQPGTGEESHLFTVSLFSPPILKRPPWAASGMGALRPASPTSSETSRQRQRAQYLSSIHVIQHDGKTKVRSINLFCQPVSWTCRAEAARIPLPRAKQHVCLFPPSDIPKKTSPCHLQALLNPLKVSHRRYVHHIWLLVLRGSVHVSTTAG